MKTKILELLEKNAKLSIKEIAEELDIKEKEALQLVGELEADKVICGYSAIINWDNISGGYDFMVIINGKSMKEVSSFVFNKLATIDYVQSTATHFVLKKYKDHGVLLEDKKIDKRTNIVL